MRPKFEEIEKNKLLVTLVGRIDIYTAPDFEQDIKEAIDYYEAKNLILDFSKVTYVSSCGLRAIIAVQKYMSEVGKMELIDVCPDVYNVFTMTGFSNILTIKQSS